MEQKLTGIPETMIIPLWARAVESGQEKPIIQDIKAVEMVSHIDYDFSIFEKSWLSQVGVSIRTMLLDNATITFIRRNPGAVVVNLGSGLDTRYERLKDEGISFWYDLDVPDAIELRRVFFTEGEKNKFIAKSCFDLSWMEDIDCTNKSVLIIAEGLLMYFSEAEVRQLFQSIASHFLGGEMLFEMLASFLIGRSKHHESIRKIESAVEFKWGLKDS